MMDTWRTFSREDPDFPTSNALKQILARNGAIREQAKPASLERQAPCGKSEILMGKADKGGLHLDLQKVLAGRLLIQGSSGAGKSATCAV